MGIAIEGGIFILLFINRPRRTYFKYLLLIISFKINNKRYLKALSCDYEPLVSLKNAFLSPYEENKYILGKGVGKHASL